MFQPVLMDCLLCVAGIIVCCSLPTNGNGKTGGEDRFDIAKFRNPDSFHRPSLMWIWNDVLTKPRLKSELEDMASHRVGGALFVPEPKEFRPTWMPTRMEPDYLSEGFVERVAYSVQEAKRLGMKLWLYDEGGWPLGSVCGRLVGEHPEMARQILERTESHPGMGETVSVSADALAGFLYKNGERIAKVLPGESLKVEIDGSDWFVFHAARRGSYPDLLNPAVTDTFIKMTHDKYASALAKEMGGAIPAIFTDEPQASGMPWTNDLPESFQKTYRYDIVNRLPSLFGGDTEMDCRARIDYHDWWSRRFAEGYLGRIRKWCHEHNIQSAGHLNGEDEPLGPILYGFGNLMRCMRHMDIPGIDTIWRQIWPGQNNTDFPKQASSVIHQEGRKYAISESFAVYGAGLTPEQMKWVVNYEFVRGINLLDMVGYPYSVSDWLAGGERPHFHRDDPLWEYMPTFFDYTGRLSYLLSLGEPAQETAIYYPLRDIWTGGKHAESTAADFARIARMLIQSGRDCDYMDDDVLNENATVKDGSLNVGKMAYKTIIVPPCSWMPLGSMECLRRAAAAGVKVAYVDADADAPLPADCVKISENEIPRFVPQVVKTNFEAPDMRVLKRMTNAGALYFLTNEGNEPLSRNILFNETFPPVLLDPETGKIRKVAGTRHTSDGWEVNLKLPFAGSAIFHFPKGGVRTAKDVGLPGEPAQLIDGNWFIRRETSFTITGTDVASQTHASDAMPVKLGDWRKYVGEDYSGSVVYETAFNCDGITARTAQFLDLGSVCYAAKIELNGKDCGALIWRPWVVNIAGHVKAGQNFLRITVSNTMANQYLTTKKLDIWTANQLGPYHPRALKFEPDSLPSGLFGPVVLRAAVH